MISDHQGTGGLEGVLDDFGIDLVADVIIDLTIKSDLLFMSDRLFM